MRSSATAIRSSGARRRGFALIATLTLLALLVAAVVALSALVRVEAQAAANTAAARRARAQAIAAVNLALGQLQRYAGPDDSVTMAAGSAALHPNWTGVWGGANDTADPDVWLVSGNEDDPLALTPATAVADPTLSADSATVWLLNARLGVASAAWRVKVPKIEVRSAISGYSGRPVTSRFAYWISDEGGKVSLNLRGLDAASPPAGYPEPRLTELFALVPAEAERAHLLFTDQAGLAGFSAAAVTQHWTQITAQSIGVRETESGGIALVPGSFNVNTQVSAAGWRAVLAAGETALPAAVRASPSALNTFYDQLGSAMSAADRPLGTLIAFQAIVESVLPTGSSADDYLAALEPVLSPRSDTFLIRGYGESVSPSRAGADAIEAVAFLEALVQRTVEPHDRTDFGRVFRVQYLRWLNADDI